MARSGMIDTGCATKFFEQMRDSVIRRKLETEDTDHDNTFDLNRFTSAQEGVYDNVLTELRRGQKRTHWMWYIFPQFDGLGRSTTAKLYLITTNPQLANWHKL